jgi:phage FluMu gp28-like protein
MAEKSYKSPISGTRVKPSDRGPRAEIALMEIALIEGLCKIEDEPILLEPFQAAFLASRDRFRCVEKSRQVGYSWIIAAECMARAHMRDTHAATVISYNLGDATEKIRYAKMLAETLPSSFRKKLTEDSKTAISFESANGATSRIVSWPSKAPRGRGGDIYLDELAHYQHDEDVYGGSTALIGRYPKAQLTVCSTPAGRRGTFWAIAKRETDKVFPRYIRQRVPWWLSRYYCHRPDIACDDPRIWAMSTDERIEVYGNETIREQYESLLLEIFQQEFECAYVDEAHSFFPWELLLACAKDIPLEEDAGEWDIRGRLTAGYDVGRVRDLSAMTISEEVNGHHFPRYVNTWARRSFEEQYLTCVEALDTLPIAKFRVDANGIGMQLAEDLVARFGERVEAVNFTPQNKELWATDVKVLLERRKMTLPKHRDLLTQMHAIRRTIGAGGKPRFDAERNAGHHGDLFWSLALAVHRERGEPEMGESVIRARVI